METLSQEKSGFNGQVDEKIPNLLFSAKKAQIFRFDLALLKLLAARAQAPADLYAS